MYVRTQKNKWLKLQMSHRLGASYNILHRDQAVLLVQAMYRSALCR